MTGKIEKFIQNLRSARSQVNLCEKTQARWTRQETLNPAFSNKTPYYYKNTLLTHDLPLHFKSLNYRFATAGYLPFRVVNDTCKERTCTCLENMLFSFICVFFFTHYLNSTNRLEQVNVTISEFINHYLCTWKIQHTSICNWRLP